MVEMNSFIHGDCMDYLPQFPDEYFDLAIVDPPYGINVNMNIGLKKGQKKKREQKNWDKETPADTYFDELFRVSKNQIIWGGNYFNIPPCHCFLIWDKGESMYGRSFSECEFAWTSFDESARIFKYYPNQPNRIHPTQKPIALYEWILSRYAKKGDKIIDTHVGSASSLIACRNMGYEYIGFEKDEYYYDLANKRLEREKAQMTLFDFGIERESVTC